MSAEPYRVAIVYDGQRWHVRHIRIIEHDLERDEKVYRCDAPLASGLTLADSASLAAALTGTRLDSR